ncbi:probable tubulin polyglutamylase ttll-15 [Amphiura filiformis]|uniref:probable tubulin polyglutamylase ttll-15 n=1 Tax=Amphiura filiformis TaxID=82378 RepID=UPI003B225EAD
MLRKVAKLCLKCRKAINHFPGIASLASKSYFNTHGGSRYLPKTFELPQQKQQFLQHIQKKKNKQIIWIQKNKGHRGNQVKETKDLDLNKPVLIQQFVHNQFLLHGHVINIGIHVIITSAVPLRAYILDSAWLMRICSEPYDPNDFSDIKTYVTDGEHMDSSVFKFPPMKRYFDDWNYSRKQSLQAHVTTGLGESFSLAVRLVKLQ